MDITRTGATMAATLLAAAVATPLLLATPASATYGGNDGRLYFGAFAPAAGNTADLYSTHIDGEDLRQLTDSGPTRHDICPALSADGKRVALCSDRTGNYEIWTMDANGRDLRQLTSLGGRSLFPDWSPAGDEIAFGLQLPDGTSGIWAADAVTGSPHRLVPAATAPGVWADRFPAYSPDGSTVLFVRQLLERNAAGNWCPSRDSSGYTISAAACRPSSPSTRPSKTSPRLEPRREPDRLRGERRRLGHRRRRV